MTNKEESFKQEDFIPHILILYILYTALNLYKSISAKFIYVYFICLNRTLSAIIIDPVSSFVIIYKENLRTTNSFSSSADLFF